jgi:hypothetical protein
MGRYVAHIGRGEIHTKFWLGSLKGENHSEDRGVGGRIVLRWILRKSGLGMWIGFI